ncbi:MAG: hypothetical protein JKY93_00365 [Gammaproteobacteria bacterium]|nr:hypothetical protein [Gammaproteobacteria bacterium]
MFNDFPILPILLIAILIILWKGRKQIFKKTTDSNFGTHPGFLDNYGVITSPNLAELIVNANQLVKEGWVPTGNYYVVDSCYFLAFYKPVECQIEGIKESSQ